MNKLFSPSSLLKRGFFARVLKSVFMLMVNDRGSDFFRGFDKVIVLTLLYIDTIRYTRYVFYFPRYELFVKLAVYAEDGNDADANFPRYGLLKHFIIIYIHTN